MRRASSLPRAHATGLRRAAEPLAALPRGGARARAGAAWLGGWALLGALGAALGAAPALAQVRGAATLDELAKATGAPLEALRATKAERLFSTDVYERRAWLKEAAEAPRGDLLGVICHLAEGDPDWPIQLTAVKVLSVFALHADREDVALRCLPLLEGNCATGKDQVLRYSIEEVARLQRWFRLDERLAPALKRHFDGPDFNIRSLAFDAICDLRHPRLVEEVALPCAWQVYESNKSSLFDRRQALRLFIRHEVPKAVPTMQRNLTDDGRVAVVSAYGLGKLLDPSSLKQLRRIDHTAVHSLRMLAFLARCRLNDPACLKEAVKAAESKNEHDEIKRSFVAYLGEMTDPKEKEKVRELCAALGKHASPAVRLGAALARLKLGDGGAIDLVVSTLAGPWEDNQALGRRGAGWMMQLRYMDDLLRIESPAADPAIVAMIDVRPKDADLYDKDGKAVWEEWFRKGNVRSERLKDWYDEYKADAVMACGERRIAAALPKLRELSYDKSNWGHMKLHAIVSRVELGDEKALKDFRWFLPRYDDLFYRDIDAVMGKTTVYTKRIAWSTVFDVCDKLERVGDAKVGMAIVEELLRTEHDKDDPMAAGWAGKVGWGKASGGKGEGATTVGRGDKVDPATGSGPRGEVGGGLPRPPEVPYRLRNQFARRRAVECAGRLGGAEAAPILARAVRDSRSVVRAGALIEIGRISGLYDLPDGALPESERKVLLDAIGWLRSKGAWPE